MTSFWTSQSVGTPGCCARAESGAQNAIAMQRMPAGMRSWPAESLPALRVIVAAVGVEEAEGAGSVRAYRLRRRRRLKPEQTSRRECAGG
jgi:hypothetical protein